MYSVEKDNKPENTMIGRESTLILRGVENAGQEVLTSRRKDRERSFVGLLSAGRVKPKEGRGLGLNDIAIRTVDIYIT